MKTTTIATAVSITALLALTPTLSWAADATSNQYAGGITHRINGQDRIATNYRLIKQKYGDTPVGHAYLARADLGADALSAAPLATKDPILLVNPRQAAIDSKMNQITPLGITEVTVIGGNQAIPQQYVDALGVKTRERLAGKDRYETNLAVIRRAFPTPQTVFTVNGDGMVDTVAATAVSLTQYGPLMLVNSKGYTASQEDYIESNKNSTVTSIGNAPTYPTRQHRISQIGYAQTPQQISALVAKQTYPSGNDKIYLANSTQLADAISAGFIKDGPVLLVDPTQYPTEALLAAKDLNATHITALGGEQAIPQRVLDLFGINTTPKKQQPQDNKKQPSLQKTKPHVNPKNDNPKQSEEERDKAFREKSKNPTNPLGDYHDFDLNPSTVENWENPDTWTDLLIKRMKASWASFGKETYDTAIYHDENLDQALKTGEGISGTLGLCTVEPGTPAATLDVALNGHIYPCWGSEKSFGLQKGDKVETATGIYIIDRVSFGVRLKHKPVAAKRYKDGNPILLLRPQYIIRYEGHPQTGGDTQPLDESGFIKAYHQNPKTGDWETRQIAK